MPRADSQTAQQRRPHRKYASACLSCRLKKRSCDGQRPVCGNCVSTEEECVIPSPARYLRLSTSDNINPKQQTDARLADVEAQLARLTSHVSELENRLDRSHQPSSRASTSIPSSDPSGSREVIVQAETEAYESGLQFTADQQHEINGTHPDILQSDASPIRAPYRLTVDPHGNVTYHGVTGLSHDDDSLPQHITNSDALPSHHSLTSLAEDASQNRALIPLYQALATSKHISVAPQLGDALLNAYYCYDVFEISDRALFIRDMALGGPCYSELLLMILYASASRMIDGLNEEQKLAQGDLFIKLAKAYLYKELEGPSKITTIQSLILLSSRECALGDLSQGWNHAGLAFRMIQDLGIHHDPAVISGITRLSLEEQANRDRIFWSAFIWDKALSLALGREPTVAPRPNTDRQSLVDIPAFSNDEEPWVPYFAYPSNCPQSLHGYVYPHAMRTITFRLMASLCVIVHDIMMTIYASGNSTLTSDPRQAFITSTRSKLDRLWDSVPGDLKSSLDVMAPPPYIFVFLMFYHAAYILLYRPILDETDIATAGTHVQTCLGHSAAATNLTQTFGQTFGYYLRYIPRYSWFVAASFDVCMLDCKVLSIQEAALERLTIWLEAMQTNLLRAPSMKRSVHNVSSRAREFLSQNPSFAVTPIGKRFLSVFPEESQSIAAQDSLAQNGSFDFYDLFGTA